LLEHDPEKRKAVFGIMLNQRALARILARILASSANYAVFALAPPQALLYCLPFRRVIVIKPAPSRLLLLPFALASLFVLAGCGIKGPLELPADAQVSGNEGKGKGEITAAERLPGYQPRSQDRRAAKQMGKPVRTDQPFFLDPLLR
jgi:predicted small lipoprotein YifL